MARNNLRKKRGGIIAIAAILAVAGLGACDQIERITGIAETVSQDFPSEDDTFTSILEVTREIEGAMSRGETELSFNIADVGISDLENIGANMSYFWGKPVRFDVHSELKGVDGIVENRSVDVISITHTSELSDNYHVYNYIKNGVPVPVDRPEAKQIADILPGIATRIFTDGATDYEKALAAHDWLVANIDYDEGLIDDDPTGGDQNEPGSYGAFILNRTQCQGYADAFELLLRCYTDIEVVQIVGDALNPLNGETHAWAGHSWNAVKLGGTWYQVDVTFDDPIGNPGGRVSHFYFGQTDEMMSLSHRWTRDFFPVSEAGDFLYFRHGNLFIDGWESFEARFSEMLAEEPIGFLEVAIKDGGIEKIEGSDLQFAYDANHGIDEIWWEERVWNDIHVLIIELLYI